MLRVGYIVAMVTTIAAAQDFPTSVKARIAQRGDFGSKLKVSYVIQSPEATIITMCAGCDVDDNGNRMSNEGYETTGSTCGGYPSGCAVIKPADWVFDVDTISLNFRVGESVWSSEKNIFSKGDIVKGSNGVEKLERVTAQSTKNEL
jgi:hypothetical protein